MEQKAKLNAMLEGKDLDYINNLQWYDSIDYDDS